MANERPETTAVLDEIGTERFRQEQTHRRSQEHDDTHSMHEWAWLIGARANGLSCPWPEEFSPEPDPRRALVEIAAIAVAAIESYDRQHAEPAD